MNTFKFSNVLLNNNNYRTQIDVCSTFDLKYKDKIFINNETIKFENKTEIRRNQKAFLKKIKNTRFYNKSTNTRNNLLSKSKPFIRELYDFFEEKVLQFGENIIVNYLSRSIVFKTNKRILEIYIGQNFLNISMHKEMKKFDIENNFVERRGYEKTALCYTFQVTTKSDIDYCIYLINIFFDEKNKPYKSVSDILEKYLKNKIILYGNDMIYKKTKKYYVFCTKKNFIKYYKTNYGLNVRILKVEDQNNIFDLLNRSTFEPLCLSYRAKTIQDIDLLLPYIKKSYTISHYNSLDYNNNLMRYYYSTNSN